MKTYSAKPHEIKRDWYVVDASGKVLGRLPAEIAHRLRGKHKPEFTRHIDTGDFIVVVNVEKLRVTGTFKPVAELKKLYADAGIDGKSPVITYCRIGERSSHTWFVLKYLLGLDDVRNYDGSWTEYGNLIGVPIEKP